MGVFLRAAGKKIEHFGISNETPLEFPIVCPGCTTKWFLNFNTPDSCYFTFTGITTNERTVREQSAAGDFYFKPLQFSAIM